MFTHLKLLILRLVSLDRKGVTAIEYSLLASLIAVVIVTAAALIGSHLTSIFAYVGGKLTTP